MPQLAGPTDPAADARWPDVKPRKGFFTDTSICIGCKACEVACKEWNHNPRDGDLDLLESSYDNTGALGASTWRHVAFIEQGGERPRPGRPGHARRRPSGTRGPFVGRDAAGRYAVGRYDGGPVPAGRHDAS